MKVYVATSWRNEAHGRVIEELRRAGYRVYDFKNVESAFSWDQIDSRYPWPADVLRDAVRHPLAVRGYGSDLAALRECAACVIVLPCGRSAHWELGWAQAAGKRTFVLVVGDVEPEIVYAECELVTSSLVEIIRALGEPAHV